MAIERVINDVLCGTVTPKYCRESTSVAIMHLRTFRTNILCSFSLLDPLFGDKILIKYFMLHTRVDLNIHGGVLCKLNLFVIDGYVFTRSSSFQDFYSNVRQPFR